MMFREYIPLRVDLSGFINPIFGCNLVCSCILNGMQCHAKHLQSSCGDIRDKNHSLNNNPDDYPYNHEVSTYGDCDNSNDEYHDLWRITGHDETLTGESLPKNVSWPKAWKSLVDDMRSQQFKVFWELSSGSGQS